MINKNAKLLCIGVSKYDTYSRLDFCLNDIRLINNVFINQLAFDERNIINLGENREVKYNEVKEKTVYILKELNANDTFILYFSGHGKVDNEKHYLCFSDRCIPTQQLIDIINEEAKCKSKIIILDTCYSGTFSLKERTFFNNITENIGSGTAVFASCNSNQCSYEFQEEKCSLFTYFLNYALSNKIIRRNGKVSLDDIQKLVSRYLYVYNSKNKTKEIQTPIYKSNVIGSVYFELENIITDTVTSIQRNEKRFDNFILMDEKESNPIPLKKYCVKVILKKVVDEKELSGIIDEILNYLRPKKIDLLFAYIGEAEEDIKNSNYSYRVTWCSNKVDNKYSWWYKELDNSYVYDDKLFCFNSFYSDIKNSIKENTVPDMEMISILNKYLEKFVENAEKIKTLYQEFINDIITEDKLFEKVDPFNREISELFVKFSDLGYPSLKLNDIFEAYNSLFSDVYDIGNIYNYKNKDKRDTDNRKRCMDDFIKRYNEQLQKISKMKK